MGSIEKQSLLEKYVSSTLANCDAAALGTAAGRHVNVGTTGPEILNKQTRLLDISKDFADTDHGLHEISKVWILG